MTGKPRVLVMTTYYHPVLGGVETHARALVRHLHGAGFPVQVVTKRTSDRDPVSDTIDGVTVHRVWPTGPRSAEGKWTALPFFFSKLLALRSTFDVIVCVDYRGIGVAAISAGRLLGRPVIVQAGTAGVLSPPQPETGVPAEGELEQAIKGVPRTLYRTATAYVCISRDIERETLHAGVSRGRVHYIPHGVDVERFHPAAPGERDQIRAAAGWPLDRLVALFVGRLTTEKGTLDLLEAWRLADRPDAVLVLVGPDMPAHSWDAGARARAFVAEHGLADRVRIVGPVDDPAPLYRAADVFTQPSHFEAFGISAIEAMASGVAVVASNVGGLRDFLTDDVNALLYEPRNPRSLATALGRALDDPVLRARLAGAGRQTVTQLFDERILLDRYAEVIETVVRAA